MMEKRRLPFAGANLLLCSFTVVLEHNSILHLLIPFCCCSIFGNGFTNTLLIKGIEWLKGGIGCMDYYLGSVNFSKFLNWGAYAAYLGVCGTLVQTIVQRADKSADENNIRLGISLVALGDMKLWFLNWGAYAAYLGVCGTLVQTIVQRADKSADENNIRLGISLVALGVNFAAYLWLWVATLTDDIPHNHWKVTVFKIVFFFTGILAPYAAYSMLAPDWFTWYVFAIICTVITLYKCYNVLKSTFIWAYKKVAGATKHVIGKLLKLIWGDQSETNAAQAPPRASV